MMSKAHFSCLSPPRVGRWRLVFPEDAWSGETPARAAEAASDGPVRGVNTLPE